MKQLNKFVRNVYNIYFSFKRKKLIFNKNHQEKIEYKIECAKCLLPVGKDKSIGTIYNHKKYFNKIFWIIYAKLNNLSYRVFESGFYLYDKKMLDNLLFSHKNNIEHILPLKSDKFIEFIATETVVDTNYYNKYKDFCDRHSFIKDDYVYKFIAITFQDDRIKTNIVGK